MCLLYFWLLLLITNGLGSSLKTHCPTFIYLLCIMYIFIIIKDTKSIGIVVLSISLVKSISYTLLENLISWHLYFVYLRLSVLLDFHKFFGSHFHILIIILILHLLMSTFFIKISMHILFGKSNPFVLYFACLVWRLF